MVYRIVSEVSGLGMRYSVQFKIRVMIHSELPYAIGGRGLKTIKNSSLKRSVLHSEQYGKMIVIDRNLKKPLTLFTLCLAGAFVNQIKAKIKR
jgi:hypothetical protein